MKIIRRYTRDVSISASNDGFGKAGGWITSEWSGSGERKDKISNKKVERSIFVQRRFLCQTTFPPLRSCLGLRVCALIWKECWTAKASWNAWVTCLCFVWPGSYSQLQWYRDHGWACSWMAPQGRSKDKLGSLWENAYIESFNGKLRAELSTVKFSVCDGKPKSWSEAGYGVRIKCETWSV